jgi:hypothetical protein
MALPTRASYQKEGNAVEQVLYTVSKSVYVTSTKFLLAELYESSLSS